MATFMPVEPRESPGSNKRVEQHFYTIYLAAILLAVLVGFAPSFFLRGLVSPYGTLRPLRAIVVLHGLLATAWLLLFPIQAWLISKGKRTLHIQLGKIGFLLAAAMVTTTYFMAIHLYHEPPPPGLSPALNVVLPLTDFFTLTVLLSIGWRRRLNMQTHKRIMVIIACLLAGAAIFRLPFWDRASIGGIFIVHLALYATILPLWFWDFATLRKLHQATVTGSVIVGVDMFGRLLVAFTPAWAAFVAALPGFGTP